MNAVIEPLRHSLTKVAFVAYLLIMHAILAAVLMKPEAVSRLSEKMGLLSISRDSADVRRLKYLRTVHTRMDPTIRPGATVFLGDSLTMALATSLIVPEAVNYGIGGQTSEQLIESMELYKSITTAKRVVVTIGTNDVLLGRWQGIDQRLKAILSRIPAGTETVMSSIPPIDPKVAGVDAVDYVRRAAETVCHSDLRCTFIDTHKLLSSADSGEMLLADGVHLTPAGYEVWISELRRIITKSRA